MSSRRLIASLSAGAAAAGAARLAYSVMERRPPGGPKAWSRTNHRGEPVTLLEGPAVAVGAIAGVLSWRLTGSASGRASAAIAIGGAGAAAFGAYDDLAGSGDRRGFRGHLGALRHGEVTTGAVKLGGIGATGIVSAVLAGGSPADVVVNAGLVAGGANLLNLFDLRPGRAIKVAVASAALIGAAGQDSVAPPVAAALALLPEDLGERAMLGDAGANALGAMLGASAAGLSRPTRIVLLAGIAGLTAASEKVSFTKVIERTPALRWLDMLGRRPAPQPARRTTEARGVWGDGVPPVAGGFGGSPPRTSTVTAPVAERGSARQRGGGIGRAAVLIGAITMLARVIGFGRQVVFAHTVQASCLGTAYTTANMVPNIIYDIVMGGALTAVVVPVLAGPALAAGGGDEAADREQVRQTSAALLTWTVLLLVPVSVLVAVIARPLVSVLLGGTPGCPRASMVALGARMLVVFAPQILLYGLAVVLYGILQSHRRFAAPALAPVLSSLVVIGAYFWFGVIGNGYQDMARPVPVLAWVVLAAGTTAGVAALVATPLIPAARLHLALRPALRFPAGVGVRVRALATAGVATLIAQDASVVVVIVLANSYGSSGALVLYGFAWAVFFVPYAVLAVPIATSAFPELSARSERFDATSATSTRAVMVASWLGAAGMAGTCIPLARVFQSHLHQAADARQLAIALAAFAPGLIGYGLTANLSRVLYADGRSRAAALAVSGGWLLVIVADLCIVPFVPQPSVLPWLGAGTSIGLTGSGVALVVLVRRFRGPDALRGCARAALAGLAGALAAAAAGLGVSLGFRVTGFLPNVAVTLLASGAVLVAFLAVVAVADGGDLRAVLRRVIRV